MKTFIRSGTLKRIHVNRLIIAQNRKHGTDRPAWSIQTSKGPIPCRGWEIVGTCSGDQHRKQLGCGARLYIETRAEVGYWL